MEIKSDFIRCPACRGAKQVMQLGAMMKNCRICRGSGKIKDDSKANKKSTEMECKVIPEIEKSSILEEQNRKSSKLKSLKGSGKNKHFNDPNNNSIELHAD